MMPLGHSSIWPISQGSSLFINCLHFAGPSASIQLFSSLVWDLMTKCWKIRTALLIIVLLNYVMVHMYSIWKNKSAFHLIVLHMATNFPNFTYMLCLKSGQSYYFLKLLFNVNVLLLPLLLLSIPLWYIPSFMGLHAHDVLENGGRGMWVGFLIKFHFIPN